MESNRQDAEERQERESNAPPTCTDVVRPPAEHLF
jgi:hypothetical protein